MRRKGTINTAREVTNMPEDSRLLSETGSRSLENLQQCH